MTKKMGKSKKSKKVKIPMGIVLEVLTIIAMFAAVAALFILNNNK